MSEIRKPQEEDYNIWTVRPLKNIRDSDESSETYGQRINVEITDSEWESQKQSVRDHIDNWEKDAFQMIRMERDQKLSETDWAVLPDNNLSDELNADVINYRKQLRDLPSTDDDPVNIIFPKNPLETDPFIPDLKEVDKALLGD
tara:strand:- start:325 stop:756 length:432 start_codon:yes stop_codon:yes gene_type:complete